jgi:uncharacterized protein YuzE
MTDFVPRAAIHDGVLAVRLMDGIRTESASFEGVLDLDDFGKIVGVEILDFQAQVGGSVGNSPVDGVRWSYDREIDAFYLHITDGQGSVQRSVLGMVSLDPRGRAIEVELPVSAAS